ncbi:hypothetical protein DRQ26_03975 [bacterium]|nr:MAG: hypothetical protein DRQ26_03975 [bacterium]
MRFRTIYGVFLLLVSVSLVMASSFGQAGSFLRFGASARSLAMGGAYSVVANNGEALLYNPAGLGNLEKWELTITHAQLYLDSRYEFVSFAYPVQKIGNFGLAIADMGASQFDGRDKFNRVTGDFGIHDLAVIAGYGRWVWGRRMRVGGSLKYWMSSVGDSSASGFGGVDVGIVSKELMRKFKVSLAIQNIAALDVGGDKLPMTIRAGVGYRAMRPLYITADVEMAGKGMKPRVGAEYKFGKIITLRAGYNFTEVTFGLGLALDRLASSFKGMGRPILDYGGAAMNPAGNDFVRFSLTFRGAERYKLSDLMSQTDPCANLTQYEGMLDKDGLIGAKANLLFGDCYFRSEYRDAPLSANPNFKDAYDYFREGYISKFGKNWTQEIMATEGSNLVFSQRTHYMFAEAAMQTKGITEDTKKLIQDLIFVGGDSAQYDIRLEYDLAYTYENLGYLDSAKAIYGKIAGREDLERPIRPIAMYRLAYLLRESDPDSAVKLLDNLVRNFSWGFYDENKEIISYPMFPKYKDNIIADDALLLMGDIYSAKGGPDNLKKAVLAYLDIMMFYPDAEKHILLSAYENCAAAYESLGMNDEASAMRTRMENL